MLNTMEPSESIYTKIQLRRAEVETMLETEFNLKEYGETLKEEGQKIGEQKKTIDINFNKWNVKHLTYTICTFEDTNWESIDISKWNTSYLAETRDMFGACNKKNIRIKKFPVK